MSISRRTALATTAAALTTAAITAPIAIKAAGVQAALAGDPVIAHSQRLRAASKAWCDAIDAYEAIAHERGYRVTYDFNWICVKTRDGHTYSWGADSIQEATEDGRLTPKQGAHYLAQCETERRETDHIRGDLGLDPFKAQVDRYKAEFWDLRARLLEMPATTPGGVLAKLHGFYHDDEIAKIRAGDDVGELPGEYATSIYRDLERLSEGARS